LVDGEMAVGRHRILWNGLDQNKHEIAAGVYLYRLAAIGPNGETMFTQTKRMTVLK